MYKIDYNKLFMNDVEHHFKRYRCYISDDRKYKFYNKKDLEYYNNQCMKVDKIKKEDNI
jgi:hypothetical protein